MAEATFYLKAYCDSDEQAEAVAEEVKVLFTELDKYYAARLGDIQPGSEEFARRYPHVAELLQFIDLSKMYRIPDVGFAEGNLYIGGSILYYYAIVNHNNDWSPITAFLQQKWGCKADWISDEYINPFDLI